MTPTVRRGRWQHYTGVEPYAADPVTAWQLEDAGWWLRRRTGAMEAFRFCSYCYMPPYSWWHLYRVPPAEWLFKRQRFSPWQDSHGHCTHRHYLKDAMAAVERAYEMAQRERILAALANPYGRRST